MLNQLKGVFESLNAHDVRYVTIGGIAAILHGVPRATFDLDILIEATPDNAARLLAALEDAGVLTATLTDPQDLLAHAIMVFKDWVRIDVQTRTPGIEFSDAWRHRQIMSYQGARFYVVSKADLIASKRAAGRAVDLEDVRMLEADDEPGQATT